MRQRQPDGTDLLPARHQTVEDPPGHDEVRAGIPVAQREASGGIVERRGRSCGSHERGRTKWDHTLSR